MDNEEDKSRWSDMASGIGYFFILLGLGGCIALSTRNSDKPLVHIEMVQPHKEKP